MFTPIPEDTNPLPTRIRGTNFAGKRLARVPTTATYQEVYSTLKSLGASDSLIVSTMAVMSSEQPAPNGYKASNYNFGGVDITNGSWNFDPDVHNGYVVLKEGGTGQYHAFASFKDLRSGLKFKLEKLQKKGFDNTKDVNSFALQYYTNWNGLGYRTLPQFNSIRAAGGKNNAPYGTSIWAPADTQAIKLATNSYVKIQNIISKLDPNFKPAAVPAQPELTFSPKQSPTSQPQITTQQITTQQTSNRSDYIEKIYKDPFKTDIDVRNEVLNRELPLFKNYLNEISKADVNVSSNYLAVITEQDLQGEFLLIDGVNSTQAKQQAQVKTLLDDKLKAFSPDAKYSLINSALFEILPDNMRNKMSENSAKGGANPNFSHAWRAPGKLSVTADFTIPGIAGLRIGQIFWIDRISEAYKSYGAFQLFGLTENIDIGKGWTTSIHSRFNALPRSSKAKYLIDSSTDGQTVETATNATSQAK